jgi:hypothetical protein
VGLLLVDGRGDADIAPGTRGGSGFLLRWVLILFLAAARGTAFQAVQATCGAGESALPRFNVVNTGWKQLKTRATVKSKIVCKRSGLSYAAV